MTEQKTEKPAAPPAPARQIKSQCMPNLLRKPEQSEHADYFYETIHPWDAVLSADYWKAAARWFTDQRKRWRPDTVTVLRCIHPNPNGPHWWERAKIQVTGAAEGKYVTFKVIEPPHTIGAPDGAACSWPSLPEAAAPAKPTEPAKKAA